MDETVPFGSGDYWIMLGLLAFGRGMDFFSTWVATPDLRLEGNPLARRLGWKWGGGVNVVLCGLAAVSPLGAIVIATASLLVAAHNFQNAWLMRSLGGDNYNLWHFQRLRQSSLPLYIGCLLGQTSLVGGVGGALAYFGDPHLIPVAIGWGIVCYAIAVTFYTLLSLWRSRRSFS